MKKVVYIALRIAAVLTTGMVLARQRYPVFLLSAFRRRLSYEAAFRRW
jgi:hypothetical protein